MSEELEAPESIAPYIDNLVQNLGRADNLVDIYNDLYGKTKGRKSVHKVDILRAAVVFTHAALEDFLRSVAATYLPKADEKVLDTIPLVGLSSSGRPEKFFLGKLASHRGKSIDQVIDESVVQYLERSNYNNTQEIAALLSSIGLDVSYVSKAFPELEKMIRRRHQIVHRADRVSIKGKGKQYAQTLSSAVVKRWISNTRTFMSRVLYQIYVMEETRAPAA